MNVQKTGVISLVLAVVLGGTAYFAWLNHSSSETETEVMVESNDNIIPEQESKPEVSKTKDSETEGWKMYTNSAHNFSFEFPEGWVLQESDQSNDTREIVSLQSPETIALYNERKIEPGFSLDMHISYVPDLNQEFALGMQWEGQRKYNGLDDLLSDEKAGVYAQKIGELTINGQKAYEVIFGGYGARYGILIERDGLYRITFDTATDKSELTPTQKQILSTIEFTK